MTRASRGRQPGNLIIKEEKKNKKRNKKMPQLQCPLAAYVGWGDGSLTEIASTRTAASQRSTSG